VLVPVSLPTVSRLERVRSAGRSAYGTVGAGGGGVAGESLWAYRPVRIGGVIAVAAVVVVVIVVVVVDAVVGWV
jgi:hypothetical protein